MRRLLMGMVLSFVGCAGTGAVPVTNADGGTACKSDQDCTAPGSLCDISGYCVVEAPDGGVPCSSDQDCTGPGSLCDISGYCRGGEDAGPQVYDAGLSWPDGGFDGGGLNGPDGGDWTDSTYWGLSAGDCYRYSGGAEGSSPVAYVSQDPQSGLYQWTFWTGETISLGFDAHNVLLYASEFSFMGTMTTTYDPPVLFLVEGEAPGTGTLSNTTATTTTTGVNQQSMTSSAEQQWRVNVTESDTLQADGYTVNASLYQVTVTGDGPGSPFGEVWFTPGLGFVVLDMGNGLLPLASIQHNVTQDECQ